MKKITLLAILGALILMLSSCTGGSGSVSESQDYGSGAAINDSASVKSWDSITSDSTSYDSNSSSDTHQETSNSSNVVDDIGNKPVETEEDITLSADKIVYHANVDIQTADFKAADESLSQLIVNYGMIVQSREYGTRDDNSKYEEVSLRVPSDKFDEALSKASDIGKVTSSNTYADNITQQYIDVESKIEAKEKRVERIKDFIAGTSDYNELRSLYGDLETAEYELDNLKSQLKNLKLDVAYSYLMITITDTHKYTSTGRDVSEDSWFAARGYEIWDSMSSFRVFLTGIVTFVIYMFPYAIIAAIIAYICVRHSKKRKAKKLAQKKSEDTKDDLLK